ncbi:MAG: DUF6134 family protein [Pseudomonadota bacterium]
MKNLASLSLLAATFWLTLSSTAAFAEDARVLAFEVFRDDAPIGYHSLTFTEMDGETSVEIDIALDVTFAFINLYSYRHKNREVWRDGKLVKIDTQTDDNGDSFQVSGQAREDGFWIEGTSGNYLAPADIYPTSYWQPGTMSKRQLLDSQSGRLIEVGVEARGPEKIDILGQNSAAERFDVSGDLDLSIWYGPAGEWAGLQFEARGADITYRRIDKLPKSITQGAAQ